MTLPRRQFLTGLAITAGTLSACQTIAKPASRSSAAQAETQILTPQRLEDALTGSSYLGTGGGGSLAEARELIRSDLADGLEFRLLSVDDLPDTARVACPYGLGSIAPGTNPDDAAVAFPVQAAFEALQDHVGQDFAAVILGEIGPGSLAEALSIAARLGVPALDADTVGRAVPEINQHSVKVAGVPLTPSACVTQQGDDIILRSVMDTSRAETVFRALSAASGVIGVVDSPINGRTAKRPGVLVQNSFTLAENIGRAVRLAKVNGTDPITAARDAGDGYDLFEGRIAEFDWADADGFLLGSVTLTGTGQYTGQRLRLDYKNEHLIARMDGRVIATCPDLITSVDVDSADGIDNPDFAEGQAVRVLGFRCDPLWRTEAGLAVFSPRYFGYDVDYIPIEQRLGI